MLFLAKDFSTLDILVLSRPGEFSAKNKIIHCALAYGLVPWVSPLPLSLCLCLCIIRSKDQAFMHDVATFVIT